jgi:hypothetical protein
MVGPRRPIRWCFRLDRGLRGHGAVLLLASPFAAPPTPAQDSSRSVTDIREMRFDEKDFLMKYKWRKKGMCTLIATTFRTRSCFAGWFKMSPSCNGMLRACQAADIGNGVIISSRPPPEEQTLWRVSITELRDAPDQAPIPLYNLLYHGEIYTCLHMNRSPSPCSLCKHLVGSLFESWSSQIAIPAAVREQELHFPSLSPAARRRWIGDKSAIEYGMFVWSLNTLA